MGLRKIEGRIKKKTAFKKKSVELMVTEPEGLINKIMSILK